MSPDGRRTAAFFDLDRTLLEGASWPYYLEALRAAGVVTGAPVPALDLLFALFRHVGETYPTVQASRLAAGRTRGWPLEGVDAAARAAVPRILAEVHPYARSVLERHRDGGDLLVLATTTPYRLAEPLAGALGFDACIATRYGEQDGAFDGTIDGPFVWNRGKYRAVRAWAEANGVSVAASAAYSDSFFDAPLLDAVARPVAVNPDLRLALLAALRGWPMRWLDKPPGVVKIAGRELQDLARPLLRPDLLPNVRLQFDGIDHLPRRGGAVLVAERHSRLDPVVIALLLARVGRTGRYVGGGVTPTNPLLARASRLLGAIRPGHEADGEFPGSEFPDGRLPAAAVDAVVAGEIVVVSARRPSPHGPVRLAAATGVPIVPVRLRGTDVAWPADQHLPRLDLRHPPLVTVEVGEPVTVAGDDLGAAATAVAAGLAGPPTDPNR